jgi:HK97 family phage major capsid protein
MGANPFEQVTAQLDGLQADINAFVDSNRKTDNKLSGVKTEIETIKLGFEELRNSLEETDKWCSEIEAKASRRAASGIDGRNALLESIQPADRKHVALAEAFGYKNPIQHTAKALWLQKTLLQNCQDIDARKRHDMLTEARLLERGFGEDLVSHAAQGETTAGTGVETILTPVEAEVLRLIKDNSYIRNVARVMPMVSKTHQVPSLDTDVIAYFAAEAATITDSMSATNWSQKALTAKKLSGLATLSNELLQDNIVGLPEFLFGAIAEQIGRLEDTEALEGTGTNWTGVNSAVGVNTIAATTNGDAIAYKAKIIKAIFLAAQVDSRQNAAWFMSEKAAVECFGLTDTGGMPIFQAPNALTITQMPQGAQGTLMGYPVYVHSGIKSDRTKGTGTSLTNIYFGNWKKLLIGDLLGLTFFTDPYSLSSTDSVKVRVTKRTGCVVGVPSAFTIIKDITTT